MADPLRWGSRHEPSRHAYFLSTSSSLGRLRIHAPRRLDLLCRQGLGSAASPPPGPASTNCGCRVLPKTRRAPGATWAMHVSRLAPFPWSLRLEAWNGRLRTTALWSSTLDHPQRWRTGSVPSTGACSTAIHSTSPRGWSLLAVTRDRTVLLRIGSPSLPPAEGPSNAEAGLLKMVSLLFCAAWKEAQGRPDAINEHDRSGLHEAFVLSPHRAGMKGDRALAGSGLGGFAGYFMQEFREHDFLLGRCNARAALASNLCLQSTDPLFAHWTDEQRRPMPCLLLPQRASSFLSFLWSEGCVSPRKGRMPYRSGRAAGRTSTPMPATCDDASATCCATSIRPGRTGFFVAFVGCSVG